MLDEGVIRMQSQMYGFVAAMHSVNAKIESMKVANSKKSAPGYGKPYKEEDFVEAEKRLEEISVALRTQI